MVRFGQKRQGGNSRLYILDAISCLLREHYLQLEAYGICESGELVSHDGVTIET